MEGGPRHIVRGEPSRGFLNGVIRRACVAYHNRVHFPFDGAHQALNNPGLIFDHAQKDDLMLRRLDHYIVLLGISPVRLYAVQDR